MGCARTFIVTAAVAFFLLTEIPCLGAAAPVIYRAPVSGPVIDPYRPPSTPYGPGNRGIDYATVPGETASAVADGEVTFAGPVGGSLHVVVLHADGIRTSLSFLAGVVVRRGQLVVLGQKVGWTGVSLHFGARRGEAYLDPGTLLAAGGGIGRGAVLVPEGPSRPLGVGQELASLRPGGGERPIPEPVDPAAVDALELDGQLVRAAALAVPPVGLIGVAIMWRRRRRVGRGYGERVSRS